MPRAMSSRHPPSLHTPIVASNPNPKRKRRAQKFRGLNALEIAEKEVPDTRKTRQHRLGEIYEDDDEQNTRQDADGRSSKRRKVGETGIEKGVDEEMEGNSGSDLEGERWHVMGEGRGDGENGEEGEGDEDSEIESEDALGSDDEERFSGFRFKGSKGTRVDEEGSGEESEGSLGEEAVDLATAWDMDDQDQEEEKQRMEKKRSREESEDEVDGSEGSEEEESGQDGGAESDLEISDAEEGDGDHTRLQSFVQSLSRKPDSEAASTVPRSTKISAADLLQYVKDPAQRQSLKILANSERKGPDFYKGGIPGLLSAPLAKRQQDRLDRAAAYGETKKDLDKWVETVKQNRRAEHLSFPLIDPNDPVAHDGGRLGSVKGQGLTELERKMQEIMDEQGLGMDGEEAKEDEELEEQQVPYEVIQARRAELRKQRDLMFREEIRARRIKKIKSKAYRRVHRKERMKELGAARADGGADSEEEREKMDKIRAEERMGRRYRESKWGKAMREQGKMKWDEGARGAMEEAARRDDELRRRVEGRHGESGEESGSEGSDELSEDEGAERLEDEMLMLETKDSEPGSRLGQMAFMQRAEAAKKARNDSELAGIRQGMNGQGDLEASEAQDVQPSGRQRFGQRAEQPKQRPQRKPLAKSEFEERLPDDDLLEFEDETETKAASSTTQPGRLAQQSSGKLPRPASNVSARSAKDTPNGALTAASTASKPANKQFMKRPQPAEAALDEYTSSSGSDDGAQPATLADDAPENLGDLVFAGEEDTIDRDFAKEKADLVVEEGDQIIDNALPGWGSWTGVGVSKKAQNRQKNKFLTTIKGVAPEKRQDAKLDRVIINEKRIKKNGKYLATELPHPFESKQQYERSLRLPLGPEWTTKSTFQDATKPRVLVKQGVIKAMVRPQT